MQSCICDVHSITVSLSAWFVLFVLFFHFSCFFFFFFKQKTAYEIYKCDWSSDVCSSDLAVAIIAVFVLFPVLQGQTGCIVPSGPIVSKSISPSSFTGVEATGHIEVFFEQGTQESVRIEASENIAGLVNVAVEGDTLKIFLGKEALSLRQPCPDSAPAKIFISAPVLKSITALNSAKVFVEKRSEEHTSELQPH